MSPLPHWIFLFGTMILYFVIGLVVFMRYSPSRKNRDGGGA